MKTKTYEPSVHLTEAAQAIQAERLVIAHYIFTSLLEIVLKAYEDDTANQAVKKLKLEYIKPDPNSSTKSSGSHLLRISVINYKTTEEWVRDKIAISVPIELLDEESVTRSLVLCREKDQVVTDSSELKEGEYRMNLKEAMEVYESRNLGISSDMWESVFASLRRLGVDSGMCAHKHLPSRIYSIITKY